MNLKSLKLPINKWIFNEFINMQKIVSKNIEDFRFDEASKRFINLYGIHTVIGI